MGKRGEPRSSLSEDGKDGAKLYIITAATKFLLRDGQMIEMLRLHDLFFEESWWQGEFSLSHSSSWNRVNPTFLESYRPRECLQPDEFWISYRDFCYHFCDFIICSSTDAYEGPGKGVRRYKEEDIDNDNRPSISIDNSDRLFPPTTENTLSLARVSSALESTTPSSQNQLGVPVNHNLRRASIEITVRENMSTVKVDNVLEPPEQDTIRRKSFSAVESGQATSSGSSFKKHRENSIGPKPSRNRISIIKEGASASMVQQQLQQQQQQQQQQQPQQQSTPPSTSKISTSISRSASRSASNSRHGSRQGSCHSSVSGHSSNYSGSSITNLTHAPLTAREMSIGSNLSGASSFSAASSDTGSIFSVSDIKIKVKGIRRKSAPCRPKSVPPKARSNSRSNSIPLSSSSANLFDAHVDNFRSRGGWREIIWQHGQWTKSTAGGSRIDMSSHSKNPRFLFTLNQADAVNEITPTCARGKCHMLASVMQDYRQGARTAHSMLSTIGFCIYRCKNQEKPEKDERRSLNKLTLIDDIKSEMESREITSRLDLDPGSYILVPYTMEAGQCGDFLVRILGERDEVAAKTAW